MTQKHAELQSCDYYFDSYAHYGIHEDMLKDKVRTLSYENAILQNPSLFEGKVVLDVGCGTGIMSMFAAKAGARKVYAVEKASIVDYAKEIVSVNGFAERIEVIAASIEDVEIPEPVDVVVSEWMGYCLLYESMLPSVILARDKFMKPEGTMFPTRATMYIAGIEDAEYRSQKIDFWDNVYGFSYAPIKKWALLEPLVETCPEERIITHESVLKTFDLNKCTVDDLNVEETFSLVPFQTETMHALVVWFDVDFDGPEAQLRLSTSPMKQSTHWSHTIFYLENPIGVVERMPVEGKFKMFPNLKNPRDQDFEITLRLGQQTWVQVYKMR